MWYKAFRRQDTGLGAADLVGFACRVWFGVLASKVWNCA